MAPLSLTKNTVEVMGLVASETKPWVALEGSNLITNGHPILTQVPHSIVVTGARKAAATATAAVACFVGFDATKSRSRHVALVGRLRGMRFMNIFRFKVRWTTHWVGTSEGDVEHETQGAFVRDLKEEFGTVEHVHVWHALCGVRPDTPGMPESRVRTPVLSPGLEMTMEDLAVNKIANNGNGLVPPETVHEMYDGLHSHLRLAGIDASRLM